MQQLQVFKSTNSESQPNSSISKFEDYFQNLSQLEESAKNCRSCSLCIERNNVVISRGNPKSNFMIIGEGPGQQEDLTGLPFVGKAGKLLDKILESVKIDPDKDVYICNVVKCRPPGNRVPSPEEIQSCKPFLEAQIQLIKPELILLAGTTAVHAVLKIKDPISKLRGKWFKHPCNAKMMPIFHPSYLLRNDSKEAGSPKWLMWQDIKEVKKVLDSLK